MHRMTLLARIALIIMAGLLAMSSGCLDERAEAGIIQPSASTGLSPSPALTPTPSPEPSPSPQPTATPTPTPQPTATPTPTPWPQDGIVYYKGFADPRTIDPEPVADPLLFTALVNKYYALSSDFVPPLVTVDRSWQKIQPAANTAWIEMRDACRAETGVKLEILSIYRSFSCQRYVFSQELARKGVSLTVRRNALEGRSEHQLGLALDLNDGVNPDYYKSFAKTKAGLWLSANAYRFGFIERYPEGKEVITDYAFEPWHYRYVGLEPARICSENGWVLEEYVASLG
jgi:zinc D-Ala-D-Ala carboxypeptidase